MNEIIFILSTVIFTEHNAVLVRLLSIFVKVLRNKIQHVGEFSSNRLDSNQRLTPNHA